MKPTFLVDELELRRRLLIGKEHESGGRAILLYGHSADMLREQQAEIEKLKNIIIEILKKSSECELTDKTMHDFNNALIELQKMREK